MHPPPCASPRRVVSSWETSSLLFLRQPPSDATPLCSRRAPLLPRHCTPLLQAPKHPPPHTTLVCLCATPSRPLSHRPPQATVKAPSRPPPSVAEAALPSSATFDHRHAPPSSQRPPLHEPQAGALHRFSGLPSPVPNRRLVSPSRAHHGEPLRRLCPKSGSLPPGLAPWHLLARPLAANRPEPADEPRTGEERGSSPVSAERVERPNWARPFSPVGPSATASVSHCNSVVFLLSFKLFKFQFKFSLNF
jgi:hypothetical protein